MAWLYLNMTIYALTMLIAIGFQVTQRIPNRTDRCPVKDQQSAVREENKSK